MDKNKLEEARELVLSAFSEENGYFSQVVPFGYTNWIDGMAWVGLLCGASLLEGDKEVAEKAERYLRVLLEVGPDARNFAPMPVSADWIRSEKMPEFWYKKKAQSFAGPAGLRFAIDCGAKLQDPFLVKHKARWLVRCGPAFGWLVRWIPWLRQHVNSVFLAYLVTGKTPSKSLIWLCEENPFYSYIARRKCRVEYPDVYRWSEGHEEETNQVVPFAERKPGSWPFKNWPYKRYVKAGVKKTVGYTPTCILVGEYLQNRLP